MSLKALHLPKDFIVCMFYFFRGRRGGGVGCGCRHPRPYSGLDRGLCSLSKYRKIYRRSWKASRAKVKNKIQTGLFNLAVAERCRRAGTHTALTAAGRYAFQASMASYASGIAKGVARIGSYKVCWKDSGCFNSDTLVAIDTAIKDGVDVISISIDGGDRVCSPYYLDHIAIGSYGAIANEVFVSSSAGNDGPNEMSVTSLAQWLTIAGAGTIDLNFTAHVTLANGFRLSGVSLYSGPPFDSKIGARVVKGLVVQKDCGVGMVLANGMSNADGPVGDAYVIPTAALGANEGDAVKSYISSTANPTATIDFRGTQIGIKPAPVVASSLGSGPNGLNPEVLKPDSIAPG
ncbi:hypothetical protein NL676_015728 [Syzygium grande]|nr:hypothetical protein NL676_015728 [Syzygium grande]